MSASGTLRTSAQSPFLGRQKISGLLEYPVVNEIAPITRRGCEGWECKQHAASIVIAD